MNDDSVNMGEMSRDLTGSEILLQENDNLMSGQASDFQHFLSVTSSALQQQIETSAENPSNIDLMRLLEDKDGLLTTLQRDKDYYES